MCNNSHEFGLLLIMYALKRAVVRCRLQSCVAFLSSAVRYFKSFLQLEYISYSIPRYVATAVWNYRSHRLLYRHSNSFDCSVANCARIHCFNNTAQCASKFPHVSTLRCLCLPLGILSAVCDSHAHLHGREGSPSHIAV